MARTTFPRILFPEWFEWSLPTRIELKREINYSLEARQMCTNEVFLTAIHWEMSLLSLLKLWCVYESLTSLSVISLVIRSQFLELPLSRFFYSTCFVSVHVESNMCVFYVVSPVWISTRPIYTTPVTKTHPRCFLVSSA